MQWLYLALVVWAIAMNLIPVRRWWVVAIMAAVGVSFVIRLWREYHKCPTCGETDPRKMRVKAESGNWIPWYLDGRDLVHCPDRWHVRVPERK